MRIEIFPWAADGIIRQFRYYLVDEAAPTAALRFREAVIESIEQLKPHPRMGSLVEGSIPGLRSCPEGGDLNQSQVCEKLDLFQTQPLSPPPRHAMVRKRTPS